MSTDHELRLKIDATPAEAGAKRFTAAIASVRKAVEGLEKDSTGAFQSLARIDVRRMTDAEAAIKRTGTAATSTSAAIGGVGSASDRAANDIRRMALASANALRVSTDQASRLRDRLLSVGDTAGLAKLEAGLSRLRSGLINATSALDIREARSGYADLASDLNRVAREAERLNAIAIAETRALEEATRAAAQKAATLDSLRAKYNPLYSASMQYAAALEEIALAEREGVISTQLATRARDEAARTLTGMTAAGKSAREFGFAMQNSAYQVGDFFVQIAAGTDPMRAMAMQLPQLLGAFGLFGAVAGAAAAIMGALIPLLFSGGEKARTFNDAMSDLTSTMGVYRDSAAGVNGGTTALREEFGLAAESAQRFHNAMAQIATMKMETQLQEGVASLAATLAGVTESMALWDYATTLPEALRPETLELVAQATSRMRDEFGLTLNQAHALTEALSEAKMAKGPEATSAAMGKVVALLLAARNEGAKLPPPLIQAAEEAATLGLNADRLQAILAPIPSIIGSATGQTNAWAGAMSGVLSYINGIAAALSRIGGGMVSAAAKSVELKALKAGNTARESEVARLRFENESKLGARQMGADAKGGVAGWVESALIKGERALWEKNIALDDQLNAAREAARKAESSAGGGSGGGGGRSAALSEEAKATAEVTKSLTERLTSLQEEKITLEALATSQFATTEASELYASAMVAGKGAVDDQTMAMLRQIDVAAKLNEELKKAARDPVKEWMDSVPNWLEAGKQIEMGAIDSLKSTLSDFIKTGKFDLESLGESILGLVADIVADKAVKELMTLLGRGEQSPTGGFGGMLAGLFSSQGDTPIPGMGDAASIATGGQQAGATIATSMTTAGQQVAADLAAAMTQGGSQAGASVQSGLATGSATVRTAAHTGLATGSNNIRIASSTGGAELGRGVVEGSRQGAPILSAAVAGGAGGGGGGMFSFESIAGMLIGAFSEGGMSNSPVGFSTVSPSAFRNAPHFSQGTANTSGIPAILHENEAVIPLSKGRKIGVELNGDSAGGGGSTVQNIHFTVNTPDADSFRRSRGQVESDLARAGQRSLRKNG